MLHALPRFFTRKLLARLAFCLAVLLTLLVVFYCVEKWRGNRAWNAYVASAQQRGVKLWLSDLATPELPPSDNYAAIPCIQEFFQAQKEHREASPALPKFPTGAKRPDFGNDSTGTPLPLEAWRDYFVAAKEIPERTADSAKDLLTLLAERAPALQQLREAAPRSGCRFPTDWSKGLLTEIPHVPFLRQCVLLFRVSASARLAVGDTAGALGEIQNLLRLAEALRSEFGLLPSVVANQATDFALGAISEGLVGSRWTDADLVTFELLLAPLGPIADYRRAIGSERGFFNTELDRIANQSLVGTRRFSSDPNLGLSKAGMALYPSGWVRQTLVKANEYYDFILKPFESVDGREPEIIQLRPSTDSWVKTHLGRSAYARAKYSFFGLFQPDAEGLEARYFKTHNHLGQVRVACAIERYRPRAHRLPEYLQNLVPHFLPSVPKDIRGEELRYQYSVRQKETATKHGYLLGAFRIETSIKEKSEKGKKDRERKIDWLWEMPTR